MSSPNLLHVRGMMLWSLVVRDRYVFHLYIRTSILFIFHPQHLITTNSLQHFWEPKLTHPQLQWRLEPRWSSWTSLSGRRGPSSTSSAAALSCSSAGVIIDRSTLSAPPVFGSFFWPCCFSRASSDCSCNASMHAWSFPSHLFFPAASYARG